HHNLHLKIHRFLQVAGGLSASAFGAAAISTVVKTQTPHACVSYWWKTAFYCWTTIAIVTFLVFEFWWQVKGNFNRVFCIKYEDISEDKKLLDLIKREDKLPIFTWQEINERVQRGVIGTDITNDFYKEHADKIVEDIDASEALLIPKVTTSRNYSSVLAKHMDRLRGRSTPRGRLSMAKYIDNINTKYYSREPLAQHAHSRFAIQKLATMVIGKVNETMSEKEPFIPGDGSAYQNIGKKSVEIDTQSIKFHRYKLTSKKMVNANVKYPVISFTFSKLHQDENDVYVGKFLPGHYIEVQSRVNGQIVIRSYTPLEGSLSKSFIIYVKIYQRGLFSQHLNEQLIGYEIQARGPFDVCDKNSPYLPSTIIEPLSPVQRKIILPSTKLYKPYSRPSEPLPTAKTSLLNPDSPDGCWDELYMIAGGTGVTPMLQLIKYYLEQPMKQKDDTHKHVTSKRMHLLFGNRKIEDVIDGESLENIALSSQGQLTVTYCLSEPPPDWDGLRGRINKQIIQEWMKLERTLPSSIESKVPPTQPEQPSIDPELSTGKLKSLSGESYDMLQGKIIVSGPSNMLFTVEQALLEMGFNEQNIIILH
ncbi:19518_t:CDS:2, partial [Gigaspora margarita]